MSPSNAAINPLLVELICRQLSDVTSSDQDVCTVTCDPDDASLWVRILDPAATTQASAGLMSYGLQVAVTGADTIHISGWSDCLLPAPSQRAKRWIARLRTPRVRWTDQSVRDISLTSFGALNDFARADGLSGPSPVGAAPLGPARVGTPGVGYPPVGSPPVGYPTAGSARHEPNAPDSASLIDAIDTAADIYQRLLDERIAFAEYMLTIYLTALQSRYATAASEYAAAEPADAAAGPPGGTAATSGAPADATAATGDPATLVDRAANGSLQSAVLERTPGVRAIA